MVKVLTEPEYQEFFLLIKNLKDEVKELRSMVEKEFVGTKEACSISGKTGQRFYDFVAYHDVRTVGRGKGIRYKVSDIEMGLRNEK